MSENCIMGLDAYAFEPEYAEDELCNRSIIYRISKLPKLMYLRCRYQNRVLVKTVKQWIPQRTAFVVQHVNAFFQTLRPNWFHRAPESSLFDLIVCNPDLLAGYGHSTPQTDGGKVFCMVYASAGIPLCIVMFQSVGERLNTFVTFLLRQIKKFFKFKEKEVSQTNLIMVASVLSLLTVGLGAWAFAENESWGYIDAVYYCFITLTTIGFGDFVALRKENALHSRYEYIVFSLVFILVGLTVISAAMNLLVLRFLTMNTEDERRDELEAAAAAQTAVRLEGDVITSNGNVVSGAQENPEFNDVISVCSCSCYNLRNKNKHRYKVTRLPGKISHLLPMHSVSSAKDDNFVSEADSNSIHHFQHLNTKRASV